MLKYVTQLTTAVFVGVSVTGLLLFFELGNHSVKEIHEYLGILFVLAGLLHAFKNLAVIKGYLRKKTVWISFGLVAIIVGAGLAMPDERGEGPRGDRRPLPQEER